jgi:hypothetical protein
VVRVGRAIVSSKENNMSVTATTPTQQARLDGTSKKKPSKAEKQAAMKAIVPASKVQDQKSVPAPKESKEQDQKSTPEPKGKDQKSAKKKKASLTLINYLAHKKAHKLGMEQKIKLLTAPGACPKTRGAATKFKKYKDGMTVQNYIDVLSKDLGKTARQTMDDIHWDFVSGFISLDGKSFTR